MKKKSVLLGLMSTMCLTTAAGCGKAPTYQVSTAVTNEEYGSISGSGKYELGETVRIKVYPNAGCSQDGITFIKAGSAEGTVGEDFSLQPYIEEVDGVSKTLYYYLEFALDENKIGSYTADFVCNRNTEGNLDDAMYANYTVSYAFPGKTHEMAPTSVRAGRKLEEVNFVDGIDGIITWYADEELTTKYDFTKTVNSDMTLYGSVDNSVKSIVGLAIDRFHKEEKGLKISHATDTTADYAFVRNLHLYEDDMYTLELVLRDSTSAVKKVIKDGIFYEKITAIGSEYEYTGLQLEGSNYANTAYGYFSNFTSLVGLDVDDYLIEVDQQDTTKYYLKKYTKVMQGETEVDTVSDNQFKIGETDYSIVNGAVIQGTNKSNITNGSFKIGETDYSLQTEVVHTLILAKNDKGYKLTSYDNYNVQYGSDGSGGFAGVNVADAKVAMRYIVTLKSSGSVPEGFGDVLNTQIIYDSTSTKTVVETIEEYFDATRMDGSEEVSFNKLKLFDYKLFNDANGDKGNTEFTSNKISAHTTVHVGVNGYIGGFEQAFANNESTSMSTAVKVFGATETRVYNYVKGVDTTIYDLTTISTDGTNTLTSPAYNTLQSIKDTLKKTKEGVTTAYNYDHVVITTANNETVYKFYESKYSRDAYLTVTVGEYSLTSDPTQPTKLLIKTAVYYDQAGDENTYTTTFTYGDYTQVTAPVGE